MKTKAIKFSRVSQFALLLGAVCLGGGLTFAALAQVPQLRMTTPTPAGIAMPDQVDTSIGTLNFFDGVPDEATAQKVYDNLDLSRAVQTYLNTVQIASMQAMRRGILDFGPANYTVLAFEELMDSKALFLTANTSSVYFFMWLDLKDGPLVIETPPNVLGIIDNAWFKYVADFGNAGPDQGQGGKYLLLPPNYKGEVPSEGYIVKRSETYGNWLLWRGFLQNGAPGPAVAESKAKFRIYPLGQKDTAPTMNFVDVSGKSFNTIGPMDFEYWQDINETVQYEPPDGANPEILGQLAAIGINKGQPFEPDPRMKQILTEAANIGQATVRTIAARPREDIYYYYPGESYWGTPFVGGSYQFINDQNARLLDGRAMFHYYATGITPAMTQAPVGQGSVYAMLYLDENGDPLDGSKTYKVTLPQDVPAKNFWSFVVYDNQTRSMLQTDQQFPSVSSAKGKVQPNADGSYDIYFGPEAPAGMENNWVQTAPGKGWNMLFRLYGPLEPWFDQTWRPGDAVLVE